MPAKYPKTYFCCIYDTEKAAPLETAFSDSVAIRTIPDHEKLLNLNIYPIKQAINQYCIEFQRHLIRNYTG